jgi:hypothetical protein
MALATPAYADETSSAQEVAWAQKMYGLSATLSSLLPMLASDTLFNNPKNFQTILNDAKTLHEQSHQIEEMHRQAPHASDKDPSLKFIASLFARDVEKARMELERGHRAYARTLLRNSTSYCISCHTREQTVEHAALKLTPDTAGLSLFEQADVMLSMRQWEEGQKLLKKILKDPSLESQQSILWEKAVRKSLAVAVRIQKNPDEAMEVVQAVLSSSSAPQFLIQHAKAWKWSIQEWRKQLQNKKNQNVTLEYAQELVDKAQRKQMYPYDRSSDIEYLRASSILHDVLRKETNAERQSKALLLAGRCYEVLSDLGLWSLHEMYYEACIRNTPHSHVARQCYLRYETSVFSGYAGSGGVGVPPDVILHIKELVRLAEET